MKKFLNITIALLFSTVIFAQNNVTQFLGIPIDGTKSAMIEKLKAKGFTYDAANDVLNGQFNGRSSNLYIVTNKNKVYRIMVADADGSSETDIRIRFNKLSGQFEHNGKYIPGDIIQYLLGEYRIDEDEDISYEMIAHNKRFQAGFYQISDEDGIDSVALTNLIAETLKRYDEDDLDGMNEDEAIKMFINLWDNFTQTISHKSVWFTISEYYGKYYISIYYDNVLNMANGEDL